MGTAWVSIEMMLLMSLIKEQTVLIREHEEQRFVEQAAEIGSSQLYRTQPQSLITNPRLFSYSR